ncbi:hypothetical protein ACQP3J_27000, partial [Escherichia coli]
MPSSSRLQEYLKILRERRRITNAISASMETSTSEISQKLSREEDEELCRTSRILFPFEITYQTNAFSNDQEENINGSCLNWSPPDTP